MSKTDRALEWEPEPLQEWQSENTDHLPANWAWLDRMYAQAQAARSNRSQARQYGQLGLVRGGANTSNTEPPRGFDWSLVPDVREEVLSSCLGTPAIIRATYQMEEALNYFRSRSDRAALLEAEPYLRRLGKIANSLAKDAVKIRHQEFKAGLFD